MKELLKDVTPAAADKVARRVVLWGGALTALTLLHLKLVTEPTVRLVAEERIARAAADSAFQARLRDMESGVGMDEMKVQIARLRRAVAEVQLDVERVQAQNVAVARQYKVLQTKTDVIVKQTQGLKKEKPATRWYP